MSIQLSGADLLDLAVRTETEGERFYRQAAEQAGAEEPRALFTYLAEQEVRHRETFQALGPAIVVAALDTETYEDVAGYIASTVDRAFFVSGDAPIRDVPAGLTLREMIASAIAFEQQTLLFFYTLRDLVQPANRPVLDAIVAEERAHVRRLSALLAQEQR